MDLHAFNSLKQIQDEQDAHVQSILKGLNKMHCPPHVTINFEGLEEILNEHYKRQAKERPKGPGGEGKDVGLSEGVSLY